MGRFVKAGTTVVVTLYKDVHQEGSFIESSSKELAKYFKQGLCRIDKIAGEIDKRDPHTSSWKQDRPGERTEYYDSLTHVAAYNVSLSCPFLQSEIDDLEKWEHNYNLAQAIARGGISMVKPIIFLILALVLLIAGGVLGIVTNAFSGASIPMLIASCAAMGVGVAFLVIAICLFSKRAKTVKMFGHITDSLSKEEYKEHKKTCKNDVLKLRSEMPDFFKMLSKKKLFVIEECFVDGVEGIEINNLIIDQRIRVLSR